MRHSSMIRVASLGVVALLGIAEGQDYPTGRQSADGLTLLRSTTAPGGSGTGGGYDMRSVVGQHDVGRALRGGGYMMVGGLLGAPIECVTGADCDDGNVCTLDECVDSVCRSSPIIYGDVDHNGVLNVFDVFCILDGIAGDFSTCSFADDDIHPCEPNGVLNLFDVFAVLEAIAGIDPCCGGGSPAPAAAAKHALSWSASNTSEPVLRLVPSARSVEPGELLTVDAFVSGMADLRGYEIALQATGGRQGRLVLESVCVERERVDYVFNGREAFDAGDVGGARVVGAMARGGVDTRGEDYPATFTFQASEDARGTFRIAVREGGDTVLLDSAGSTLSINAVTNTSIRVR